MENRFQFVDAAKGLGILIIVYTHICGDCCEPLRFLFCFHVPLFFFLSPMFFKMYDSGLEFLRRKVNTILLPFIGMYVVSYAFYFAKKALIGSIQNFTWLDFFNGDQMFNIPLWFLLSLFWMQAIFYVLNKVVKSPLGLCFCVLLLGATGYMGALQGWPNILFIMATLSCLPWFYLGYVLKPLLLEKPMSRKQLTSGVLLLGIGLILAFYPPTPPRLLFFNNTITAGNGLEIYACSTSIVLGVILILKHSPSSVILCWFGLNSMIILVTHMLLTQVVYPIANAIGFVGNLAMYVSFVVITLAMIGIVPLFNKYLPFLIGKKEILSRKAVDSILFQLNPINKKV